MINFESGQIIHDAIYVTKWTIPCDPAAPGGPTGPGSAGKRGDEACATIPIWLAGDFVGARSGVATVGLIVGLFEIFAFLTITVSFTKALSAKSDSTMAGPNLGVTVVDPFGITVVFALCFADFTFACPTSMSPSLLMSCAARRHRPEAPPHD